jgi:hypothetical protein
MSQMTHEFERFVRRAHRRWVAWRVVERVGLFVLGACALSLPLIAVLWLEGEPALDTVAFVLAIGALLGAVWGAFHRPTLLDTAVEADRQFHLHDLLGTAMTLSRCAYADEAARKTIAAIADARCRRLAASRMVLNKLGARTWAGIGLTTALVLTLALMTASPAPTVARTDGPETIAHPDGASERRPLPGTARAPQPAERPAMSSPDAETRRSSRDDDDAYAPEQPPAPAPSNALGSGDGAGDAGDAGALTDSRAVRDAGRIAPGGGAPAGTTAAGGAGDPAARAGAGEDAAMPGHARSARATAAPWHAPTWNADRARALRDVERGAVPDAYRDLVRAYFDDDK